MCAIGVDRCLSSHCFWPLFPFILALWHFPCGISFTSALWPCVMGYWLSLPSDISSFIFVLWRSVECKNLQQQQELTARHSKVLDQRASFPLSILTRSIATRSALVKSACHEIKSHELYLPRNELIFIVEKRLFWTMFCLILLKYIKIEIELISTYQHTLLFRLKIM